MHVVTNNLLINIKYITAINFKSHAKNPLSLSYDITWCLQPIHLN